MASAWRPRSTAAPTAALPGLARFPHVDTIFERALAKDPGNRFASCAVFGEVLAAELEGASPGF